MIEDWEWESVLTELGDFCELVEIEDVQPDDVKNAYHRIAGLLDAFREMYPPDYDAIFEKLVKKESG